jgi:uracil-DNA glycosylase
MVIQVKIDESWQQPLQAEFNKPYFNGLQDFLREEQSTGKTIYPPNDQIFAAFNYTPFNKVKVVVIGQDPYHGEGQAHGLCFSVNKGVTIPPSLKNIYKELESDIPGFEKPNHGDLSHWAKQGVLMLNATLTVEKDKAGSHQGKGWELFTDAIIQLLASQKEHLVFILWGRFAQSKAGFIDASKHLILQAAHPSPFSAYNGFFGCKHFSQTNAYLSQHHQTHIRW